MGLIEGVGIPEMYETSPMPMEPRTLAERLRWLRKQRGLTQVELSRVLGCEQGVVSSWEIGRTRPTSVALAAIAKEFQISILALTSGEGFMQEALQAFESKPQQPVKAIEKTTHLELPANQPGRLIFLDTSSGNVEPGNLEVVMTQLLRALKRGRKVWIVVE